MIADDSDRHIPEVDCSLGTFSLPMPRKRWPGDLLRQHWAFAQRFSRVLHALRPDVVHVNFAIPGIWARRAARRCGVPFVVATQHELWGSMSWHLRLGLRATERRVDVHTYVSNAVAESFGRRDLPAGAMGGALPAHVVIRNGIDASAVQAFRGWPNDRVPGRIVAPGRLVPGKGQALLLRALAQLREAHPHAHLVLAGSGPEAERLQVLAAALGVADAVRFAGWLPREALWRLLASGQAAAFASRPRQEGFGLVLAEAALLEVPLVASRIAAFREVLADDDSAAYWFDPQDEAGLARQLCAVLGEPPERRAQRAAQACRLAEARASLSAMVDSYAALYGRLADARPARHVRTKF